MQPHLLAPHTPSLTSAQCEKPAINKHALSEEQSMTSNWQHLVQYYETDATGIVHHSNYVRWLEEARTWLMNDLGYDYAQMEADGVIVPVLAIDAHFKRMIKFGEKVNIAAHVSQFNGVTMTLTYEITDTETGKVKAFGTSRHAFLSKDTYRPISLRRKLPDVYDLFKANYEANLSTTEEADKTNHHKLQAADTYDFTTASTLSLQRKVQLYETDQMAIVHHSNFFRMFEEARTELMAHINFSEKEQLELGLLAFMTQAVADYKSMIRFGESIKISAKVDQVEGNQIIIAYQILDVETGDLRSVGHTKMQVIALSGDRTFQLTDALPDLYARLVALTEN